MEQAVRAEPVCPAPPGACYLGHGKDLRVRRRTKDVRVFGIRGSARDVYSSLCSPICRAKSSQQEADLRGAVESEPMVRVLSVHETAITVEHNPAVIDLNKEK